MSVNIPPSNSFRISDFSTSIKLSVSSSSKLAKPQSARQDSGTLSPRTRKCTLKSAVSTTSPGSSVPQRQEFDSLPPKTSKGPMKTQSCSTANFRGTTSQVQEISKSSSVKTGTLESKSFSANNSKVSIPKQEEMDGVSSPSGRIGNGRLSSFYSKERERTNIPKRPQLQETIDKLPRTNGTLKSKFSLKSDARASKDHPQKQPEIFMPCHCIDCRSEDDVPKSYIEELEGKISHLNQDLCKEKNLKQVIRREHMIIRKILGREIAGWPTSFDCKTLAKDTNSVGKQKAIFILKRELRELNGIVDRLDENGSSRKAFWYGKEQSDVSNISGELQDFWCLEMQRQEIKKQTEREKQDWIQNRDALKSKLEYLLKKNAKVMDELISLQETISSATKGDGKDMPERLQTVEQELKANLHGKTEQRQKFEVTQQRICRNGKEKAELCAKMMCEEKICVDKEAILKKLRSDGGKITEVADKVKLYHSQTNSAIMKDLGKIEDVYTTILPRLNETIQLMFDSRESVSNINQPEAKYSIKFKNVLNSESDDPLNSEEEAELTLDVCNELVTGSGPNIPNAVQSEDSELNMYKSVLNVLQLGNREGEMAINSIIFQTRDIIFKNLSDRVVLWKLNSEISALRKHVKKLRNAAKCPTKQNLVKKKDSVLQLTQPLEAEKQRLRILKLERKFLEASINSIYKSTQDDFDMYKVFLSTYKNLFFNEMNQNKS